MSTGSLRVLTYHRIGHPAAMSLASPQVSATAEGFARQMEYLAGRYRVVSLNEVLEAQRGSRRLPPKAILLTFDDGYRDFGEVAWPILRRLGLTATVFVPTAYPGDPARLFWWDRVQHAIAHTDRRQLDVPEIGVLALDSQESRAAAVRRVASVVKSLAHQHAMELVDRLQLELDPPPPPPSDVLNWDELRILASQGVDLAAHTRTHPALTRLDPRDAAREITESMHDLAREIGTPPPAFCYPYGMHSEGTVRVVAEAGIELAFTCLDGHNRLPATHPLRLRRTEITARTTPVVFGARLLRAVTYVDMWRHRKKYVPEDRAAGRSGEAAVGEDRREGPVPTIAYIMSRFPKLSETFVLNEMAALDAMGVKVEVFPLLRETQPVSHPEAERWTRRACFHPFISLPILRANLHYLARRPHIYVRTLAEVIRGTFGSLNFFLGGLGIFPKSVRFAYEMERLGVTHVHAHFATHPTVAALIIHRIAGIPFSFTAHGSDLHKDRRMLARKVDAADFAVTVSEFNRALMVQECGVEAGEKIKVIHCGVDPSFFAPTEQRGELDRFDIVCVASFEEVKGHRFLVDALQILLERGVSFRCHLIGDGPLRQEIAGRIGDGGLDERVVIHGGLPRAEVARHLSSAHAAVLASHPTREGKREGIPVALMEAMASGLPVVASRLTGIPELVEDGVTGLLVPSGDATALANALERLAGDVDLRGRFGAAGRARVMRDFDLRANAARLLSTISRTSATPSRGLPSSPMDTGRTGRVPEAGTAGRTV